MSKHKPRPIKHSTNAFTKICVGVVVSRFNKKVTDKLLAGCLGTLKRNGIPSSQIKVVFVPGAFEIPLATKKMIHTDDYDVIITLGAVIKGETPHFDYVSQAVCEGVLKVGLKTEIPVIFGVLTVDNLSQALERAGGKHGHKGELAAEAALEMVSALKKI